MKLEQALNLQNGDIIINGNFKYKVKRHYGFCQYLVVLKKSKSEIKKSLKDAKRYSENYNKEICLRMIKNEERRIPVLALVDDEWSVHIPAAEHSESKL